MSWCPMPVGVLFSCVLCAWSTAQQVPTFAAPVRLQAGDKLLGAGRLYPSPMAHDVDGDGRLDLVIGDLAGRLTVALRRADGTYAAETPLLAADGKRLDFANW